MGRERTCLTMPFASMQTTPIPALPAPSTAKLCCVMASGVLPAKQSECQLQHRLHHDAGRFAVQRRSTPASSGRGQCNMPSA